MRNRRLARTGGAVDGDDEGTGGGHDQQDSCSCFVTTTFQRYDFGIVIRTNDQYAAKVGGRSILFVVEYHRRFRLSRQRGKLSTGSFEFGHNVDLDRLLRALLLLDLLPADEFKGKRVAVANASNAAHAGFEAESIVSAVLIEQQMDLFVR